nr:hypothetical protein [Escherichia coli]
MLMYAYISIKLPDTHKSTVLHQDTQKYRCFPRPMVLFPAISASEIPPLRGNRRD